MLLESTPVLITGGASGLGLATAEHFIKHHAKVAVIDKAFQQDHHDLTAMHCINADVTDDAQIARAIAEVSDYIGTPRIIINCAGIAPAKRVVSRSGLMPLSDFERVIQINLIGTFNVIRHVVAKLSNEMPIGDDNERGVIINTASIAATDGQIGQAAYAASKAGIQGLTLPLAREFAHLGIRVVTIAPGIFATPMLLNMPQEVQNALSATVPFPARLGHPEEFAKLAAHIAENTMLNGEIIRLDGALRMQAK